MRAAVIDATGPAANIRVGELPMPRPGPTDLLVRLEASEVNHVDTFVRSGAYATRTPFPFVIGRDIVGTVVAAGEGAGGQGSGGQGTAARGTAGDFAVGERVWCNSLGVGGRQGAYSEYAVVPVDRAYPLPAGVDPVDAAPVLHGAATAHIGLFREAGVRMGETVFIGGAAGAVGTSAVQMAAAAGARVVTSSRPDDFEWCRSCGAAVTLDYHDAQMYERIGAAVPGGVDVWWDTSGHYDLDATLPLLAPRARMVAMAGLGARPELPVGGLYTKDASLRGFAISNASVTDLARAAATINAMLAAGSLAGRVGATYRIAEARRAHEDIENGAVRGRIVIVP